MIANICLSNDGFNTGHCFRRAFANLLASIVDLLTLNGHEHQPFLQYIDESIVRKISMSRKILTDVNLNERLGASTALNHDESKVNLHSTT